MQFIPAIDLKDGVCVRLRQGRMDEATEFSDDPVAMAVRWAEAGASRLHIVDLDGALKGRPVHTEIITKMIVAVPGVKVQVGGGLREISTLENYLKIGADRLILGTKAIQEPEFLEGCARQFPNSILYGLDARKGRVALAGWTESSTALATELVAAARELPLAGVVYTDITKDGMLAGVNIPETLKLAKASRQPVIASGGIASLDDLTLLLEAQRAAKVQLDAVISGRALYEGALDCNEAINLCQSFPQK